MRGLPLRRVLVAWLAVVLAVPALPSPEADAALFICRRKKRIKLRLDGCKKREERVDAAELGVAGAPGGPAGGDLAGTYPDPSIAAGAVTPAKLGSVPAARVLAARQAIPNDAVRQVAFSTEVFDTAGLFDPGNATRLTAPIDGVYVVTATLRWDPDATGSRFVAIFANQEGIDTRVANVWHDAGLSHQTDQALGAVVHLGAGDYVELQAYQDSGSSLDVDGGVTTAMAMAWVGPR